MVQTCLYMFMPGGKDSRRVYTWYMPGILVEHDLSKQFFCWCRRLLQVVSLAANVPVRLRQWPRRPHMTRGYANLPGNSTRGSGCMQKAQLAKKASFASGFLQLPPSVQAVTARASHRDGHSRHSESGRGWHCLLPASQRCCLRARQWDLFIFSLAQLARLCSFPMQW